ncbi:hypothetical protein REH65_28465 [Saccharopolyspora sp. ID03-671]|uniref:hypothetical protein n=1 Tax=Saccharopolyspora sp. ID03-671 TaxID=3073066 RepID=UPI003247A397
MRCHAISGGGPRESDRRIVDSWCGAVFVVITGVLDPPTVDVRRGADLGFFAFELMY